MSEVEELKIRLAQSEAKCERLKALIDRIACSHHPKYVNCEVAWQEIAGVCAAMRDESSTDSLTTWFREQTKSILEKVSYSHAKTTEPSVRNSLGDALAKLRQLRGKAIPSPQPPSPSGPL